MVVMLLKLIIKVYLIKLGVYLVESFNDKILHISFDYKILLWNHTDVEWNFSDSDQLKTEICKDFSAKQLVKNTVNGL